jgi:AcrR family transcriptional regulator
MTVETTASGTGRGKKGDRGEATRARILETATRLLIELGAEGMSFRNVARELGMSIGNLQYYFPSRASLLHEVCTAWADRWKEGANVAAEGASTPRDAIVRMIDYWLDSQQKEEIRIFWQLFALSTYDAEGTLEVQRRQDDDLIRRVADQLRAIHPDLGKHEAVRRATLLSSIIDGSTMYLGYGRPARPGLKRLRADVRTAALAIVDAPPEAPKRPRSGTR